MDFLSIIDALKGGSKSTNENETRIGGIDLGGSAQYVTDVVKSAGDMPDKVTESWKNGDLEGLVNGIDDNGPKGEMQQKIEKSAVGVLDWVMDSAIEAAVPGLEMDQAEEAARKAAQDAYAELPAAQQTAERLAELEKAELLATRSDAWEQAGENLDAVKDWLVTAASVIMSNPKELFESLSSEEGISGYMTREVKDAQLEQDLAGIDTTTKEGVATAVTAHLRSSDGYDSLVGMLGDDGQASEKEISTLLASEQFASIMEAVPLKDRAEFADFVQEIVNTKLVDELKTEDPDQARNPQGHQLNPENLLTAYAEKMGNDLAGIDLGAINLNAGDANVGLNEKERETGVAVG
jgi:hypothetical protein